MCGAGGGRNEGPNPHDTFGATFDMQEVPINQGFPLSHSQVKSFDWPLRRESCEGCGLALFARHMSISDGAEGKGGSRLPRAV